MVEAIVALGTNLGNRQDNLKKSIDHLGKILTNLKISKVYETDPAYVTDQPAFLNQVVVGQTDLSALELLKKLKDIEKVMGRKETYRHGPRLIDLDIIDYGGMCMQAEALSLPHPLCHERDFVLRPLCDINPDWIHPVLKKTAKDLLSSL